MRTLRVLSGGIAYGQGFHKDADGVWSFVMDETEVLDFTIDWTGWLEGDTIATSAFAPSGMTENSESNTTKTATCFVTATGDPYGETVNTIVTDGGRTKKLTVRVYAEDS